MRRVVGLLCFLETRVATRAATLKDGESFEWWRYAIRLDLPLLMEVVIHLLELNLSIAET